MGLGNQSAEQRFPFDAKLTFEHLIDVLPIIGFPVKESDPVIGRVLASASLSLLSWGENLSITVSEDGPSACTVVIDSSLKVGLSWTGSHRNQKNIDKIIMALSRSLQGKPPAGGPALVKTFEKGGFKIDEYERGIFVLHEPSGTFLTFNGKTALDRHLAAKGSAPTAASKKP